VLVALVTPMSASEELDCETLSRFVDHLIRSGVHGVIPLGSTGEFYALSRDERRHVVASTISAVDGRVPVLVGANAGSTREVIEHCIDAQDSGADGVLLAAPFYSLPTEDELFHHFAAVEDAIDLPIVLYNYPDRTGVDLTPDLVERLAQLDGIQAVKESSGDVQRVGEIVRRCGGTIRVLCGSDALALESFERGAVGWITGAANVLPEALTRLYRLAVEEKSLSAARDLYDRLLPALAHFESGKYTQKVKAGCALQGHPVGPPRQPLQPLSDAEIEALSEVLRTASG